jgi:hypothetical protein
VGEFAGEQSPPISRRRPFILINPYPEQTAARGILFQDITVKTPLLDFIELATGPAVHGLRIVLSRLGSDQARIFLIAHQSNALSGYPQADLHFRTQWIPLDIGTQGMDQEIIALMTAVIADLMAQQAGADAQPQYRFLFITIH